MAEEHKTDWVTIARQRWPQAAVRGTGQYAATIGCGKPVAVLSESFDAMVAIRDRSCGPGCRGCHSYVKLEQPRLARTWKPKPHWIKYIEDDERKIAHV